MLRPEGHPLVAAMLDAAMRPFVPIRDLVVPRARGRVLEIGAGTGMNFARYDPASVSEVVAVEPDPHMRRRAAARVAGAAVPICLIDGDAEALALPDASFDTAVVTFTLCTVPRPERAIAELRRVLRPGGVVHFAEHTLADGAIAAVQRGLTPVWRRLAGGCHLDRDAVAMFAAAGFDVDAEGRGRGPLNLTPVHLGVARVG